MTSEESPVGTRGPCLTGPPATGTFDDVGMARAPAPRLECTVQAERRSGADQFGDSPDPARSPAQCRQTCRWTSARRPLPVSRTTSTTWPSRRRRC